MSAGPYTGDTARLIIAIALLSALGLAAAAMLSTILDVLLGAPSSQPLLP